MLSTLDDRGTAPATFAPPAPLPSSAEVLPTVHGRLAIVLLLLLVHDREIMTREEMEREFSLDRIGASPSVFDPEKLLWMNAQSIARMPASCSA